MPKNKIEDLRNILFETMEKLLDDDDPMDFDRAGAVARVAQVVVNTAKVELAFMKQTGHGGNGFIQGDHASPKQLTMVPQIKPAIEISSATRDEDLCLNCTLPGCDDSSPNCLIQIKRRAA